MNGLVGVCNRCISHDRIAGEKTNIGSKIVKCFSLEPSGRKTARIVALSTTGAPSDNLPLWLKVDRAVGTAELSARQSHNW